MRARELLTLKARCGSNGQISYQSNGVDFASCVITLGHAIAAGEVSCSACPETLWDAIDRLRAEGAGATALPQTRFFSQPVGGYGG
ncbi:MAG TPA: hypothetical protein VGC79_02840 [Polyangiaceae bacterium]